MAVLCSADDEVCSACDESKDSSFTSLGQCRDRSL